MHQKTRHSFSRSLRKRWAKIGREPQDSIEEEWETLRDVVMSTAVECIGFRHRCHKHWVDQNLEEIKSVLEEKNKAPSCEKDGNTSVQKLKERMKSKG